ncbi:hypothetical protein O181_095208 [Austropuccinia psidii MF-1]|uniref:Uncharacterized protein n=1 Tax=Austropuccinia psidii MF-1 TaxID=1389203 RepID=A0A9Q3J4L6_9BASI|nr:hypothetical protein [Austropuccinia psidii MF-1]
MNPKLTNYAILKVIILFYLQKELTLLQVALVDIYKAGQKAYNNALKHKEYQILADLWKDFMNSYLTVRKFLGHTNSCKQQFQHEKEAKSSEQGKRQSTSYKALQPGLQNPKDSAGCNAKCISDGQTYDGIEEKGGSQTTMSEMISDILDGIPKL